jgi:hypothetical protein
MFARLAPRHNNGEPNLCIAMIVAAVSSLVGMVLAMIGPAGGIQMKRRYALSVAAPVMDIEPIRDDFLSNILVTPSVCDDISAITIRKDPISSRRDCTNPIPTSGLTVELEFSPEALDLWDRRSACFHKRRNAPRTGSEVRVDWRQPARRALESVFIYFSRLLQSRAKTLSILSLKAI